MQTTWSKLNISMILRSLIVLFSVFSSLEALSAGGSIKFDSRLKDFGTVNRGEILKHKFHFENRGKGNLRIKGVYASCGCTVAKIKKDKIYAPGEIGEIEIVFKTESFFGRVRKTVSIMTNEKGRPDRILSLKVKLIEEFSVSIPLIDLGDVISDKGGFKEITLSPIKKFPLEVTGADFDKDVFDVKFRQEGKKWIVGVKLKKGQTSGYLKKSIYIINNSSRLSRLMVPIRANIVGNFRYSPNYLEFGSIGRNTKIKRTIQLKGIRQAKVSEITSDLFVNGNPISNKNSYIKINAPSLLESNKRSEITVTLNNVSEFEGSVHGFVKLETDDPIQKEIKVPFFAFFR